MNNICKGLPIVSTKLNIDTYLGEESPIKTPADAIRLVGDKLYDSAKEIGVAIFMDSTLTPLCVAIVGQGNERESTISARDIVQISLLCNASFVTLIHNHPVSAGKGHYKPSIEDIKLTDTITKACTLCGISMYDSIIVTGYKERFGEKTPLYYSIRKKGLYKLVKQAGIKPEKEVSKESDLDWTINAEEYWSMNGEIPDMSKSNAENLEITEY